MYIGIGAVVALTIAASFVGWVSFNRVGAAQDRVENESLPEMEAAFRMAEYSRTLAAAAPRLVAAQPTEVDAISEEISQAQQGFEDQILLSAKAGENRRPPPDLHPQRASSLLPVAVQHRPDPGTALPASRSCPASGGVEAADHRPALPTRRHNRPRHRRSAVLPADRISGSGRTAGQPNPLPVGDRVQPVPATLRRSSRRPRWQLNSCPAA